jgi:hypothetical protein
MAMKAFMFAALTFVLAGCAFHDSHVAHTAQRRLVGWTELDLESYLGAPDHQSTFGDMDILTYFGNSTSTKVFTLGMPFFGGLLRFSRSNADTNVYFCKTW